jgi:hypothetical protein
MDHLSGQHGYWQNHDRRTRIAGAHGHSGHAAAAHLHPLGDLRRDRIGSFSAADKENRVEDGAGHVFVDPLQKPDGLGLVKTNAFSDVASKQTLDSTYAAENKIGGEGQMKERKERKGRRKFTPLIAKKDVTD